MRPNLRIGLVIAFALAATVFGAVAAFAAFWVGGSGTGSTTVGAPSAVTLLAATGTPSSDLMPGASADLVLKFTNPNAYAVTLVGIAQNGTVTPVGGTGSGTACSTANTGVSVATQSGLSLTVASGANVDVHVANAASMSTASASGCQGATFQIPLTVTVRK